MDSTRSRTAGRDGEDTNIQTTHRYILEAFPRLGRAPTVIEMQADLHLGKDMMVDILRSLEAEGALTLDPVALSIPNACPY